MDAMLKATMPCSSSRSNCKHHYGDKTYMFRVEVLGVQHRRCVRQEDAGYINPSARLGVSNLCASLFDAKDEQLSAFTQWLLVVVSSFCARVGIEHWNRTLESIPVRLTKHHNIELIPVQARYRYQGHALWIGCREGA